MDIIRTTANLIGYNLESVESSVPYIEPYVFTKGLYKGKNVKELVAIGVPGLRALILMMNSSPENEYKCANSILYELMLEAQNNYGFGVCVSKLKIDSPERVGALIGLTKRFRKDVQEYFGKSSELSESICQC